MWKAVCCAVQGKGHIKNGIPCQDKVCARNIGEVTVIALADGAGSAKLSHYGAQCVVECISKFVVEHFDEFIKCSDANWAKEAIMQQVLQALDNQAWILKCSVDDLASTMLVAAVSKDYYFLIHIGDGVIGYLDDSELKVASVPENGEFLNSTVFITSEGASASMRIFKGRLKNIGAFVLMSDGAEQSLYHKRDRKLADVLVRLMRRTCLLEPQKMECQLQEAISLVLRNYTQDDCSLAILARPVGALKPVEKMRYEERRTLYRIKNTDTHQRKRVARYDQILEVCEESRTIEQIAHQIHLKPKYTRQRVERLLLIGVLSQDEMKFLRD